ncbi:hypothetical protein NONI108955_01420 [Nocardia ninae]|uniref:Uncharacterized protein n=1 Tax=Nocardia ninae NBRC 108245 TaxID=1210091 RepID=A0A511MC87_9NOCA|nr:hypothetical protein [Nocardia ninae]GEM38240.1 hypothetical protein NN4_27590 [Nocardia ninae NBRC 108245]
MNAANPDNGSAITRFGDCLVDPGKLTSTKAIAVMSEHYACPPECLPLRRADTALNTEDGAVPVLAEQDAERKWDTEMAGLCREAIRLVTRAQQREEPDPPPSADGDSGASEVDECPARTAG